MPTVYVPFSDRAHPAFRSHTFLVKTAAEQQGNVERAFEGVLRPYRTAAEVTQIGAHQSVSKTSTNDAGHSHTVTFS